MSNRTKTSLHLNKELWKEFQLWVFMNYGNRKASEHVEIALREYLERHEGRD